MGNHRSDNPRSTHTSHGTAGNRGTYKGQLGG